jgi:hypothetical protein
MDIALEAEVHPTEDPERVRRAILNLFPGAAEMAGTEGRLRFTAADAEQLARRIGEQMIRDTARSLLLRSAHGNRIRFWLHKQAALAGKVNFTEGSSVLGDITVTITSDEPEAIIKRIAGGSGE